MNKLKFLGTLLLACTVFISCNSTENLTEDEFSPQLLDFRINKNILGEYYIDYNVGENIKSDQFYNHETETHEFLLSSSGEEVSKKYTSDLEKNKTKLKIDFKSEDQREKLPSIIIEDDNISFAKGNSSEELESYEISVSNNDLYNLDFSVRENVVVDFKYNEDIQTYEIHLTEGKSSSQSHNISFEKDSNELLKIDFVNHFQSGETRTTEVGPKRKPRIIIDDGEDS